MIFVYFLLLLVLGIYSYSQIDLNLTLFQNLTFLNFQHWMIQLGYFNRPMSTNIFIALTILLTLFYIYFFLKAEILTPKKMILLISAISILGMFSYSAFSHDIFNYIFDARVLVFHHANPYTTTALMYPADDWTRFMQWTHRTYPYGPIFLPITSVFYILGLNKFVLTLFWFKVMAVSAYAGSSFLIYKISKNKGLVFFALNPLVIYEAVVAGHLDVVMLFFAILGYFLYMSKKSVQSWLAWLMSIGVKYVTVIQAPAFFLPQKYQISALVLLAYIGAFGQILSREVLPHYFLVPLGFSAFMPKNKWVIWLGFILSFVLLLWRYLPFISSGQW